MHQILRDAQLIQTKQKYHEHKTGFYLLEYRSSHFSSGNDSWVSKDRTFSNSDLYMPFITSTVLYCKLIQILMVSIRGILVKRKATSRLPTTSLLS